MLDSTIIVQSSDAAAAAWAAALGAVSASLLTGIVTYRVTRRQVLAENDRFYASQEAARRAPTADRLRDIYATMAMAAAALRSVIAERSYVRANETVDERDDRHDRTITEALNTVSAVGGRLLVEDSAAEVRKTYETLVAVVGIYFSEEATLPPGDDRAARLRALVDSIVGLSDNLLSLTRAHLVALERPVRVEDGDSEITMGVKAAEEVDT